MFRIDGVQKLETVLQFIWRDLFLSLLATGKQRLKQMTPRMLADIESTMGAKGLVQILNGGLKCESSMPL